MSRVARSISKSLGGRLGLFLLIASLSGAGLSGCATVPKNEDKDVCRGSCSRVYFAKYEEVEAAVKQAMIKYPQRVDNTEAGIFETDFVKGDARFVPAHKDVKLDNGYRYRIMIRLVRGKVEGRPSVKVQVTKRIELVRDFFSEPETLPSDGFEEDAILYRIFRELTITKAIVKATEKSNAAPPAETAPAPET